ncbi:MAG: nucleotidyl transferase AbiEii/AbiGii toxin family protein [Pirellulales bacterium]
MSESDDLIDALAPVVEALQRLGIRHYVGGSIAGSFHGATRSTMDVDLVAELSEEKISEFVKCFGEDFYLSEAAVRDAVRRRSCFNLIHLPSSFKVDIFVSRDRPFDQAAMRRATLERLGESPSVQVRVATAEDTIISKLEWFRLTNETSERQWDDVSRLIRLLGDAADVGYLHRAAESVGVADLLQRLLGQ